MLHAPARDFTGTLAASSFPVMLEQRIALAPPHRKGRRTRERLRVATAQALEAFGYHRLRVADIAEAAGVSKPGFYVYYADKTQAALEVMRPFVGLAFRGGLGWEAQADPARGLRSAFTRFLTVFHDNRGLVRCLDELGDDVPAFSDLVERRSRRWHERLVREVLACRLAGAAAPQAAETAEVLASMTAALARRVAQDPTVAQGEIGCLADTLSKIWMRSLYPVTPGPLGLAA